MFKLRTTLFKVIDVLMILTMIFGAPMNVAAAPRAKATPPVLAADKADYSQSASIDLDQAPTAEPTQEPAATAEPTQEPVVTAEPTQEPVVTAEPTQEPVSPTEEPTAAPTEPPVEPTPTEEPALPPYVQSDKADYAPGELVTLTGGNWQAGEAIHIFVNDDIWNSWYHDADVTAGEDGTFTYEFQLPNWFVATYSVKATGETSGLATSTFTDSQEDYKHYADKTPAGWQNGALQSTNSQYFEGEFVPHYWKTEGLVPGQIYGFNIYYDYYDSSSGSYCGFDYLAQYNLSRNPPPVGSSSPSMNAPINVGPGNFYTVGATVVNVGGPVTFGVQRYVVILFQATSSKAEFYWGLHLAQPGAISGCQGSKAWPGASLQSDVRNTPQTTQYMLGGGGSMQINPSAVIRGTISGFKWNDQNGNGAVDGAEPTLSGWTILLCADSSCNSVIRTTTTDASGNYNFDVAPGTYFVREGLQSGWGQIIPTSGYYGPLTINVSTPTYKNINFGNRANTITIIKDADPNDPQDFQFSSPIGSFLLDDDSDATLSNSKTFSNVPAGSYIFSEAVPSGWYPVGVSCVGDNGNTSVLGQTAVQINLDAGENITCTFTNKKQLGSITIVKDAAPNDPQDFSFVGSLGSFLLDDDSDPALSNSRTISNLTPGKYTVIENVPSGWIPNGVTCTGDNGNTIPQRTMVDIMLDVGENITCTFTNVKMGYITIVKDALPDDMQDFSFSGYFGNFLLDDDPADGTLPNSKTFGVSSGTYAVTEATTTGWNLTDLSCVDPSGGTTISGPTATIGLAPGESVTCTFTNTKQVFRLSLVKAATPATYDEVGDEIYYSYEVTNTGNVTLAGPVTVTDDKATATCPSGGLAPGASMTCDAFYTITQEDLDAGSVTNTAQAHADGVNSNEDSQTVTADQTRSLSLVKSADPVTYDQVGQTIAYSYEIKNTGNVTLSEPFSIADDKASVICTQPADGKLSPDETMDCTATYTITQDDLDAGSVTNTATASGDGVTSNEATATVNAVAKPSISLAKSAAPATYDEVGDVISYSYEVTNTGNVTLAGPVTVDDDKITVTCPVGGLAPSDSMTCTGSYAISQADLDAGSVTNTAQAHANGADSNLDEETVAAVQTKALSLTKWADPVTYDHVGQTITYSYVIKNTGNVTLSGPFSIADDKASVICTQPADGKLSPDETMDCTATYTVTQDDLDAGSVTNTATASGNGVTSNEATATVTAVQRPAIIVVKVSTTEKIAQAGEVVPYTFTVTNEGNMTLTDITVSDVNCTSAISGPTGDANGDSKLQTTETWEYACNHTVTQAEVDSQGGGDGDLDNTVIADSKESAPDTDSLEIPITFDPRMTLDKSVANAGPYDSTDDEITYSLVATNTGNVTLHNVSITDPKLGTLTCTQPVDLAPGATLTCSGSHTVTQVDLDAGSYYNIATADSDETEPVTDDVTVPMTQAPAIDLVKTVTNEGPYDSVGDVIEYSLVATNTGNVTLTDVSISDSLLGTLVCTPEQPVTLAPTQTLTCTGSYAVTQADLDAGSVYNEGTATGSFGGEDYTDKDHQTVPMTQKPALSLEKTGAFDAGGDGYANPGELITYTFVVTNTGNVTLNNVTVTDPKVSSIACDETSILVDGHITCSGTYAVTQADIDAGHVDNMATATSKEADPDTDDETVDLPQTPLLMLDKVATPPAYDSVGDLIGYSYLLTNSGNVTLSGPFTVDDDKVSVTCPDTAALAVGESITCTASYPVTQADLDSGSVTNTATGKGSFDGDAVLSNEDSETVTAIQSPAIDVEKYIRNGSDTEWKDADAATGPYLNPGVNPQYRFVVTNTGNVTLTDLALTDNLLALTGCTPPTTLTPAASFECTVMGAWAAGQHTNTATASGSFGGTRYTDLDDANYFGVEPIVSKTANGKYTEVHDWQVFKSVNVASQDKSAGQTATFTWTVRVDETTHGEEYLVEGVITVVNPNPDDPMVMELKDELDDGTQVTVSGCSGGDWSAPNLTVPAGGTAYCEYSVVPSGNMAAFNAALPGQVTINSHNPGPESYWLTTVSGGGPLDGTYEAWCADVDHTMNPDTNYTAKVYSSYESLPAGIIEYPQNLDLVNWVINQDFVGKDAGGGLGNYTYGDVQRAIWMLIEDNPFYTTSGLGSYNQSRVNLIQNTARDNGENFKPVCGDFVAVVLQPVDGSQLITIAQVTFASLGINCAESNAVTAVINGEEYPASATILWTVTQVDPSVTLDDDQFAGTPTWPVEVTGDVTYRYNDSYACPVDPGLYDAGGKLVKVEPNTAVIKSGETILDTASASTTVNCYAPKIGITKTASSPISAGDTLIYTITVTNSGPGTAYGVNVQDTLPTTAGLGAWTVTPGSPTCKVTGGVLSCALGTMSPGASQTITLASPTTYAACGATSNEASVALSNGGSAIAGADVDIQCPSLEVVKTADATSVSAGDAIGFTIIVTNAGDGIARNVTLSDTLPTGTGISWSIDPANADCSITDGTLSCSFGDLTAGGTRTVHVTSPTTKDSCALHNNTATASADNQPFAATSTASVEVLCTAIQITKIADAASVSAGDAIGFTIMVSNPGPGKAYGVSVTDTLPVSAGTDWSIDPAVPGCSIAGGVLTCDFGTMVPDAIKSIHISSPTTAATCGMVENMASVTTTNDGSGSASASLTVNCPDVTVTKEAVSGTINANDTAAFKIVVSNVGAGTAYNVTLSDTLPAGVTWVIDPAVTGCAITGDTLSCSFATLAAGASVEINVSGETSPAICGTLDNMATVAAGNEANTVNNSADASITVNCPDVTVTKEAVTGTINANDTATFKIVVSNVGEGTAYNVTLSDTLPAGVTWVIDPAVTGCAITGDTLSCSFATLAAGASVEINVSGASSPAVCGTLNNTATVAAGNEANTANNSASASITVNCPDVTVTKEAVTGTINANDTAAFKMVVSNVGAGTAYNVTLSDTLPAGVTWVIDPAVTDCAITGDTLSCSFATLAAGASVEIKVSGASSPAVCGTLNNTATVAAGNEANTANNSASANITVNCSDVTVTKEAVSDPILVGDTAAFKMVLSNTGAGTAYNVTLNDTLPAGVTWVIDPSVAGCSITGDTLSCSFATLASDAAIEINVSGETSAAVCGTLDNTATVAAGNEANTSNNSASADIAVDCPAMSLAKSADPVTYSAVGHVINYSYVIQNTGNVTLPGPFTISDDKLVTISCPMGSLAPSALVTCTATHTVTQADLDDGSITNKATASTTYSGREVNSNEATATVTAIQNPALSLTKSADPTTYDAVGQTITYTYVAKNVGNVTLSGPFTIADDKLGVFSCSTATSLAPSASVTCTATHTVTQADLDAGSIMNHATATAKFHHDPVTSNQAQATVNAIQKPSVTIVKKTNGVDANAAPGVFIPVGGAVSWTYDVTNTGNVTLSDVAVTDDKGVAVTCPKTTLAPAETMQCAATGVAVAGQYTNKGTVSGKPPYGDNVMASDLSNYYGVRDLTVSKTANPTFTRIFFWEISKGVDKTFVRQVGGSVVFNYTVNVTETGFTDSLWKVTGQITVTNPNIALAISGVTVTDVVNNGGTCFVAGGLDVTIPANGSKTFIYYCSYGTQPTSYNGVNTATASWDKAVNFTPNGSASGTKSFTFGTGTCGSGNPTNINKTITVKDTFNGYTTTLGTVTATTTAPYTSRTFSYSRSIPVPSSCQVYAGNCKSYVNTAKIVETGQTASKIVTVCGPMKTGALTIGYWQNKNGQGIIKATSSVSGVCKLTPWLRQFAPFQDLSSTASCSTAATYVYNVVKAASSSGSSMNAMLKAQMLATALDVYYSNSALGGNKIGAPAPIGGVIVDLTYIKAGTGYQDVSAAFGGATSMKVSDMLTYAASKSNAGGSMWYGNVKTMQEKAKNAFDAINNAWVFPPIAP